jgi:micrococcal nuclease
MRASTTIAAKLGAAGLMLALLPPLPAGAVDVPDFAPGERVEVQAVQAGGRLVLGDGRIVVLVGINVPRGDEPRAGRAQAALEKLLIGRAVELRYADNRLDRHGRVLAHVFAGKRWVEGELLSRGLARVESTADNRSGVAAMLAREAAARGARRGLWRESFFAVRAASDAGRYAGSFQIVEGIVVDVVAVDGALLLNFAEDWRHGFALRLTSEAARLLRGAGIARKDFIGERLRVRGFVHPGERPMIDVTHPEQIERLGR